MMFIVARGCQGVASLVENDIVRGVYSGALGGQLFDAGILPSPGSSSMLWRRVPQPAARTRK